jgi:murein L,D-transpeptidase YcbB/YkuD
MNDPLEKRIQQIIVNMERSRWVPVKLSNNYLVVNIPEYKLHVYENDSVAWSMNVVVGKDQHKTVIFNGDLKYVVFSPYWNIPTSILRKEILPALKRNRNYLSRHNMEWHNGGVRQKPGPNNSLGLVKFLFPNSHNIYLHDSPAKSLFQETDRAFSHGCIRLAEPKKLAMYLLRNDSSWTEEKITGAMEGRVEKYVTLRQPVPVFISYFTAWVDKLGKVNFRKDIYKRDERLAQMIIEKPAI